MMSEWMFEVATTTPTGWDDTARRLVDNEPWLSVLVPADDGFSSLSSGAEFDRIPFSNPADDDATPIDDVEVVGRRNPGSSQGWSGGAYDSSWFDWDGYDTNENAYQQEPPPPPRPSNWSECLDREIDDLAEAAANIINRIPDSDRKEYGFLIWIDSNGDAQLSSLIHGDNFALTGLTTSTPSSLGFSSWSQVVGMAHSHPTLVHAQTIDGLGLRYHENGSPYYLDVKSTSRFDLSSIGDWGWLDNRFSVGNPNANMLRHHILYDGNLSEYDLYQNPLTTSPDQRRNDSVVATNANGDCSE